MTTSSSLRRSGCLVVGLALGVMVSLSACAVSKEDYIDSGDELCAEVNERFGKELSLAVDSFGTPEHLGKLAKRAEVIKGLRTDVGELEIPEGVARPDDWLAKLDTYIEEMEKVRSWFQNRTPGSDLALAMSVGLHDEVAAAAGEAAAAFGFDTCAKVESWQIYPGST